MANITKLEMAKVLSKNSRIYIKQSFFGLVSTAYYKPTDSKLKAFRNEYGTEDGEALKRLFACPEAELGTFLQKFKPVEPAAMGPTQLEGCQSDDHQFVAMQLFGYSDFDYKPLTEVRIFEGAAAELISTIL